MPADRDHGNVQAFEVLLFIVILAIPLVLMQQQPAPGVGGVVVREDIAESVGDWLEHVAAAPDSTGTYDTLLDRIVAEALQGNTTGMGSRLGRILPKVTAYNVFLDNGVARYPLRSDGTPPGEAVSAAQMWSPSWAPVLAASQVALLDPQRSALRLAAVPVFHARGLQGEPGLRVEVDLELPGGDIVTLASFAPLANGTAAGPGAVVSLLDASGTAVFSVDPGAGNGTLFFGVRETQGRAVPAGTTLEVRLPPGFGSVSLAAADNPGWTNLALTGNSTYGWTARADLAASLTSAATQLQLNGTRPAWGRFHLLEAELGRGAYGQLRGLFVDAGNATKSAALPPGRGPFLSLPGSAPWSAEALAGVVVAYPDDAARTVTVKRVAVAPQGGAAVTSASAVAPASGWAAVDGGFAWSGSLALANDAAREFRFNLRASAPASPGSAAVQGLRGDAENGYGAWSTWLAEAGQHGLRFAPRNASAMGFIETAGAHVARLNATHRGAGLTGSAGYDTVTTNVVQASASDLARGLDESWLRVDTARVALGGTAQLRWDLDRLREELVGLPGDTFKCYTATGGAWAWRNDRADCLANGGLDWQLVDQAPAVNLTVHHPAPANGSAVGAAAEAFAGLTPAGTRDIAIGDDALLGTHVVELRADFALLGPAGAEAVQTVRLLGAFDVHRPGDAPPQRPLYDVVIQGWLEDWT